MTDPAVSSIDVRDLAARVSAQVQRVIEGKNSSIRLTLLALFAGGHVLIEDVPGTGKTLLASTLARAIGAESKRVQFTPDLLPTDITGTSIFNRKSDDFEFRPGAVFSNVLLADEINRATPKTQSALLEAMEEHAVSVDGRTHRLPDPFMVIATSNPVEMDGTYDLPEAQRDRFLIKLSMGYPAAEAEVRMLATHTGGAEARAVEPVATVREVAAAVRSVASIHTSPSIFEYVVALAHRTRESTNLALGVSPRGTVHAVRVAKAHAALEGRDHVIPRDVQATIPHVWAHRLRLTPAATAAGLDPDSVLESVLSSTPVTGSGARGAVLP